MPELSSVASPLARFTSLRNSALSCSGTVASPAPGTLARVNWIVSGKPNSTPFLVLIALGRMVADSVTKPPLPTLIS